MQKTDVEQGKGLNATCADFTNLKTGLYGLARVGSQNVLASEQRIKYMMYSSVLNLFFTVYNRNTTFFRNKRKKLNIIKL